MNNKTKLNKKILPYIINLGDEQIDDIIKNNGKNWVTIFDNKTNIDIKYTFKNKYNNNIYFQYNRTLILQLNHFM